MSICEKCWKAWIWACPLLIYIPKKIISCSSYEPTDAQIKSQELISKFLEFIEKLDMFYRKGAPTFAFIRGELKEEKEKWEVEKEK